MGSFLVSVVRVKVKRILETNFLINVKD